MALKIGDRIRETASTSGTSDFALAGAVLSFQPFSSNLSVGDTTWYCAVNGTEWEVGKGTLASGDVLERTTVLASSNANALVNFAAAPQVFCTVPASAVSTGALAFRAWRNGDQTIPIVTYTKIQLNSEETDTAGAFDSTTNYRFQPTVAGYYSVSWMVTGVSATSASGKLYKNGSPHSEGTWASPVNGTVRSAGSDVVFLNGSTDYIELWAYIDGSSSPHVYGASSDQTYFSGFLIR